MKKLLDINLGGKIFNIYEDAYELLKNYMDELHNVADSMNDDVDIVCYIEARIGELCEKRVRYGRDRIVDYAMIDEFLKSIGTPETVVNGYMSKSNEQHEDLQTQDTERCREHETWRDAMFLGRKLFRNPQDSVLGGVISGFAVYYGCDVWMFRLLFILFCFFSGFLAFFVYLFMWAAIPKAKNVVDLLRMREIRCGINESEEDAWRREYERISVEMRYNITEKNGCLLSGLKLLAVLFCLIICFPLFIVTVVLFFCLLMYLLGNMSGMAILPEEAIRLYGFPYKISFVCFLAVSLFVLAHYIMRKSFNWKPLKKWIKILLIIVWLMSCMF